MPPQLPPYFVWRLRSSGTIPLSGYALCVEGVQGSEVAIVNPRVDGKGWVSQINRHVTSDAPRPAIITRRLDTAMKWAERWAAANAARLPSPAPRATAAASRPGPAAGEPSL